MICWVMAITYDDVNATPLLPPPIHNIDVDVLGLCNRFCDTKVSNIDVLLEFQFGLLRIVAGLFSV